MGIMAAPNNKKPQPNGTSQSQSSPQSNRSKLRAMGGLLITCDGPLKQFLLRLSNESMHKFVMRDLDECHLFIHKTKYPPQYDSVEEWLQFEVDQWAKKYSYIEDKARVDD